MGVEPKVAGPGPAQALAPEREPAQGLVEPVPALARPGRVEPARARGLAQAPERLGLAPERLGLAPPEPVREWAAAARGLVEQGRAVAPARAVATTVAVVTAASPRSSSGWADSVTAECLGSVVDTPVVTLTVLQLG